MIAAGSLVLESGGVIEQESREMMAEEESAKNISNAEQYISILNYKTKGYIKTTSIQYK
ncbi:hypothetical protein [Yersinia bercovieri]|uniref:hypothetical protein n=1 Tax=Yersinia bercovieri TaxID=634 RepID=UPI001643C222|nr:hypothetical protein [Yersinia bercovieri]